MGAMYACTIEPCRLALAQQFVPGMRQVHLSGHDRDAGSMKGGMQARGFSFVHAYAMTSPNMESIGIQSTFRVSEHTSIGPGTGSIVTHNKPGGRQAACQVAYVHPRIR